MKLNKSFSIFLMIHFIIHMALRVYFDMPSFDGIGIDAYRPQ